MSERSRDFIQSNLSVAEVESLVKQIGVARSQSLSDSIGLLGETIHQTKIEKGWTVTTPVSWSDENQIPADLALIHSEVSEAMEAFRRSDHQGFAAELADVAIRVIGLAHGLRIDLAGAIEAKTKKNKDRPFRHGGKRI